MSSRLHRRLLQHRTSAVRGALGAFLLLGVWLLWPEPDHARFDRPGQRQSPNGQSATTAEAGDGLVTAAQASVAVSAKRQLVSGAAAVHYRLEQSLRQVAGTMPEIAVLDAAAVDQAPAMSAAPAFENVQAETAAGAPQISDTAEAASQGTGVEPSSAAAALDLVPATALMARAGAAIEPAAPRGALAATATVPAAAPAGSRSLDDHLEQTTVARLELPADVLAPETSKPGAPTWLRNAVAPVADHRPAVAIVIDDLGMNRRGTAALNNLPGPLTLAFLPYATGLDEQTRAARAAGHELLLHVPMEPHGPDWPGPNALTSELGPAELIARLRSQLRSFRGFVGVNNHMGSLLTTDPERMALLMAELRQRGLLFLDSRTTPASVAAREAERMGVPYAERDVFIDNDLEFASVLRELARAERIARSHGHAVAIGHPHDMTIEALKRWLPGLNARGIALVPVSTIVARRSCASGIVLVADACARYAVAASAME